MEGIMMTAKKKLLSDERLDKELNALSKDELLDIVKKAVAEYHQLRYQIEKALIEELTKEK